MSIDWNKAVLSHPSSSYDPMALGARCDLCFLREVRTGGPIPPEIHGGDLLAVIGESPGDREVEQGRPFVGPSGMELEAGLNAIGLKRPNVAIFNALACQPARNKLDLLMVQWRKNNAKRVEAKLDPLPTPLQCCWPRLQKEIASFDNLVPMGNVALRAILDFAGDEIEDDRSVEELDEDDDVVVHRSRKGILDARGQLYTLREEGGRIRRVLPTLHPAFVLRSKRWRPIFRLDIARALRWFGGGLEWKDPKMVFQPRPEELEAFLSLNHGHLVYDVETSPWRRNVEGGAMYDPCRDGLRCIGVGNAEIVYVVPFMSIDGVTRPYKMEDLKRILEIFRRFFEGPIVKVGHNSGYYDRMVIYHSFARFTGIPCRPRPIFDTILAHRVVDPDLPHALGFVGPVYTDVWDWKAAHTAQEAKNDHQLWAYNARDVCVNDQIAGPLAKAVQEKALMPALTSDHAMQALCCHLHEKGILIDQRDDRRCGTCKGYEKSDPRCNCLAFGGVPTKGKPAPDPTPTGRKAMEREFIQTEVKWIEEFYKCVAEEGVDWENFNRKKKNEERWLNIYSTQQVARLLFDMWDLEPPEHVAAKDIWTETGERSTGDVIMRSYISDPRVSGRKRNDGSMGGRKGAIHALRLAKRARTLRSRYLYPLRTMLVARDSALDPNTLILGMNDSGIEIPATGQDKAVIYPDGRIHADWNAGRTAPGRLASQRMNVQNWTDALKALMIPAPDHLFVGCDAVALHLVIIGSLWGIPTLQEAFIGKPRFHRGFRMGPHEFFAELIFGDQFMKSPHGTWPTENSDGKWKGIAKDLRDVGKTTRYAGAYRASVLTVFREITSAEDKKTGKLLFADYSLEKVEDIYETWMTREPEWKQAWDRTLEEWKRLGFLADPILGRKLPFRDEKETDIINGKILMTEAAYMHGVTQDFCRVYPEYLNNQVHDSLVAEVPGAGEWVQKNGAWKLVVDKTSHVEKVRQDMEECFNRTYPGLAIPFKGEAKIGINAQEV